MPRVRFAHVRRAVPVRHLVLALLAASASGCWAADPVYLDLLLGRYDSPPLAPFCFEQDGIAWRAFDADPVAAHEIALRVEKVATILPVGWTVVLQVDLGPNVAGMTVPHDRVAFVAPLSYANPAPIGTAKHELFHAALYELTGDLDEAHSDPRWEEL